MDTREAATILGLSRAEVNRIARRLALPKHGPVYWLEWADIETIRAHRRLHTVGRPKKSVDSEL